MKLIFSCNLLPSIPKGTGDEYFRRWVMVQCFNEHDYDDMDFDLIDKITDAELSGLLNKILIYWIKLEKEGFGKKWNDHTRIRALWEIDINPIKLFIEECCEIGNGNQTNYDYLYNCLNSFRKERDAKPISKTKCTQSLSELGVMRSSNRKYYLGIKIKGENNPQMQL